MFVLLPFRRPSLYRVDFFLLFVVQDVIWRKYKVEFGTILESNIFGSSSSREGRKQMPVPWLSSIGGSEKLQRSFITPFHSQLPYDQRSSVYPLVVLVVVVTSSWKQRWGQKLLIAIGDWFDRKMTGDHTFTLFERNEDERRKNLGPRIGTSPLCLCFLLQWPSSISTFSELDTACLNSGQPKKPVDPYK